jgi:4-hydroxy-tetrahydrodipicolinate reductase
MTNVVVTGAAGRMGREIIRLVLATPGLKLHGAVERAGPAIGQDAGALAGAPPCGVKVVDALEQALPGAGAVIDFTHFEASAGHAERCAAVGVPIVIGSTGFDASARARVAAVAGRIPVLLSPNMSVGVNVLFELVRQAAAALGDAYDVEIVELHHKKKKDAPSGTAVRLAEVAVEALGRDAGKDLTFARHGMIGERPAREIGVQTVRGGDIVGEHTVYFCGEGERLELTHRATAREQFARGAVRAAGWIAGRQAGLYDMADVLGFRKGERAP